MVMPYVPFTPWMATPYQVPWFKWNGGADDPVTGNTVDSWASPVLQWVQGWDILDSELLPAMETEQKFSMFLMVPPNVWPSIRDRFGFPTPANGMVIPTTLTDSTGRVMPGIFEVTGHDIEVFGFTNWQPGNIVLLKDVV
jgi:hypothetical protein